MLHGAKPTEQPIHARVVDDEDGLHVPGDRRGGGRSASILDLLLHELRLLLLLLLQKAKDNREIGASIRRATV